MEEPIALGRKDFGNLQSLTFYEPSLGLCSLKSLPWGLFCADYE